MSVANWRSHSLSKGVNSIHLWLVVTTQRCRPSNARSSDFFREVRNLDFYGKYPNSLVLTTNSVFFFWSCSSQRKTSVDRLPCSYVALLWSPWLTGLDDFYISYLLLCNKLPPNWVAWSIYYLIVFVGQVFRRVFSWVVLAGGVGGSFSWDCNQDISCSHLKAGLRLEDLILTWLRRPQIPAGCWQEASVPHHVGRSTGLLECSYNMTDGFSQSEWSKREKARRKYNAFCDLVSEIRQHHFYQILFISSYSR